MKLASFRAWIYKEISATKQSRRDAEMAGHRDIAIGMSYRVTALRDMLTMLRDVKQEPPRG
jgi:hypothetical protein